MASITDPNGLLDQKVGAAQQQIEQHLVTSLNALPQKLLSDTAKTGMQTALQAELTRQINQLRQDMQDQIDKLKSQIEMLNRGR